MATKQKHTKQQPTEEKNNQLTQSVVTRGRTFEGTVTKKFPTRVVVEFERTAYIQKYQRFYKKKTRLHARLPSVLDVQVGDYIRIRECRPLSKIIHFMVIEKVRSAKMKQEIKA